MKQRNPFSQSQKMYSDIRERIIIYKEKHPERVIAGMFLILLIAVTIFLISKATHENSRKDSASTLVSRLNAPIASAPGKQITGDIMELLSLYGKTQAINPDSLTLKDSVLIKEMDKDLKRILDEKD